LAATKSRYLNQQNETNMTLTKKINKAISEVRATAHPFTLEPYEDNYDGFTHYTYSGLADDVWEAMDYDGFGDNAPYSKVLDYVSDMM